MFFILSKTLGFFALPSNLLVSVGLAGIVLLMTRYRRAGGALVAASVMLLAIFGWSPVGNILILPLEQRFPVWAAGSGVPPDGIIVLGGPIGPEVSAARHQIALNDNVERMTVAVDLAKQFPKARILFSGGNGALINPVGDEAEFAVRFFESFGIARDRIISEDRSRTTAENAMYSKALVTPKPGERWLLVTSAYHMPRSIGAYRQAGFPVEAFPVDFRTRGPEDVYRTFISISEGLRYTDIAVREWAGMLGYWLSGRSSALFPAPD